MADMSDPLQIFLLVVVVAHLLTGVGLQCAWWAQYKKSKDPPAKTGGTASTIDGYLEPSVGFLLGNAAVVTLILLFLKKA